MKKTRRFLSKTAEKFDLPADIVAGELKIEVIGFLECTISPHKGLREYGKQFISVDTSEEIIGILGEALTVKRMNSRQITIRGKIKSVTREVVPRE